MMMEIFWNKKIDEESEINQYVDVNASRYQVGAERTDYVIYYFGSGDDGAMKLNSQNISIDGDVYNFYFVKSGENKGKGYGTDGVTDEYYLSEDKKTVAANSYVYDDKAVYTNGLKVTADSDLRYQAVDVTTGKTYSRNEVIAMKGEAKANNLVLINASGSIMKNKSSVKDGDDYYYKTNKYGVIIAISTEKDGLKSGKEADGCRYINNIDGDFTAAK